MTVWLAGAGVVAHRLSQLCGDGQLSPFDPRRDPFPELAAGDIVVLALPGRHRGLVEQIGHHRASVITLADDLDGTQELFDLGALFPQRCRTCGPAGMSRAFRAPRQTSLVTPTSNR